MSEAIKELTSLNLYEIIAGPLMALVQAETQAAKTTLEYIEKVGFIPASTTGKSTDEVKVGKVRMAEFNYRKADANGQLTDFTAALPVLSLVPIPAIQVKSATISFSVKINDVETVDASTTMSSNGTSKQKYLMPKRTEFRASMGSKAAKDDKTERLYAMDIQVTVEKSDVPVGLMKIFNMMDQAITDRKAAK
jgi:hypothetical protein